MLTHAAYVSRNGKRRARLMGISQRLGDRSTRLHGVATLRPLLNLNLRLAQRAKNLANAWNRHMS